MKRQMATVSFPWAELTTDDDVFNSLWEQFIDYNSVCIQSLPQEILLKIFEDLVEESNEDDPHETEWHKKRPSTDWLVINLVCRQWREIACAYPVFWRFIDVGRSPQWLELCLTRSGTLPVDIRVWESSTLFHITVSLLAHTHRIRKLSITHTAAPALPTLSALFSAGMHALEALYVDVDKTIYVDTELNRILKIDATRFPSLHTLHLELIYLPWRSPLISQLRVLKLYESVPRHKSSQPVTLDDFLLALKACHSLETLILTLSLPFCTCVRPAAAPNGGTDRVIALPRIRHVELFTEHAHGHYTATYQFLSHIRFPPEVQINVSAVLYQHAQFSDYVPNDTECLPILHNAVQAEVLGSWRLRASAAAPSEVMSMESQPFLPRNEHGRQGETVGSLEVFLHGPNAKYIYSEHEDAALGAFCALFASAPLASLRLWCGPTAAGLRDTFEAFGTLTTLELSCATRASRLREAHVRSFLVALSGGAVRDEVQEGDGDDGDWDGNENTGRDGGTATASTTPDVPLRQLRSLFVRALKPWYDGLPEELEVCMRARNAAGARRLVDLYIQVCEVVCVRKGNMVERYRIPGTSADRRERLERLLNPLLAPGSSLLYMRSKQE